MVDVYKHVVTKDVDDLPKYTATGAPNNITANCLSWCFNLLGPGISMDSACSSNLMALNFAVQGLRNRDWYIEAYLKLRRSIQEHRSPQESLYICEVWPTRRSTYS